ncbi:2-keto-3-deoxy-L-rhamnonate aldolase RhmA [Pseudomonas sp. SJZ079]|uniref:HpcH/HpaI aldolase family protein n=1 Tax=Pseudomonas sp. SJZ079 TaxID=2572887 RepID=UPI001198ECEC|nr:aldolase/citrate lyase family protein [Pseudomonas sp. SJZ079]TWC27946.1 2-keto-3-deoxy-L-rhamnonate aldolase RhmA [Pseudomonas sp. SJZ079]
MSLLTRRKLKDRLKANDAPLFGTFIKTPTVHGVEIIGGLGYDFVIIDAEHAPFDRSAIELLILAARASGVMALVRVGDTHAHEVLTALDNGADGVVAPHIWSADRAKQLVAMSRYGGKRGFSNSPRAGGYGARSLWEHVDLADSEVAVIAMIEDPEAIENIDAILATEGLDAIFIGRGDLTVAMNDRVPGAPLVKEATEKLLDAAQRASKPVFILAANPDEAAYYRRRGVRCFVLSSDQGFLRAAAQQALSAFSAVCTEPV